MPGIDVFCERCGARQPTEHRDSGAGGGFARRLVSAINRTSDGVPAPELFLRLCLDCRGYSCPSCWNEEVGLCQSCAPLPEPAFEPTPKVAVPPEPLLGADATPPVGSESSGAADTLPPYFAYFEEAPRPDPVVMAQPEPEAQPVTSVEPEPEPVVMAEPEPQAEPVAIAEPEPEAAVTAEPEPVALADPEPVPAAEAELEVVAVAEADPEPVVIVVAEADPVAVAEAEPEPEPGPGPMQQPVVPPPPSTPIVTPPPGFIPPAGPPPMPAAFATAAPPPMATPRMTDPVAAAPTIAPRPRPMIDFAPPSAPASISAAAYAEQAYLPLPSRQPPGSATGIRPCRNCELPLSAKAHFCRRCGTAQES